MSVSELCALMEGAHEQYEALDESEADRLGALLYDAARCGRLEEARELLVQGADPSWRNPYMQRTPLHTSAFHGHTAIVELLLAHGASINALDKDSATALHAAACTGEKDVVVVLLEHGIDVTPKWTGYASGIAAEVARTQEIRELIEKRHFRWKPHLHRYASPQIQRVVRTTTMIRSLASSSVVSMLPNELLFEVFQWL